MANLVLEGRDFQEEEEVWSEDYEEEEVLIGSSEKDCDEIHNIDNGKDVFGNCEDRAEEPNVGMEFDTSEEAYLYYSRYAKENGFAVAKRTSRKGKDGNLKHLIIQCSRGGKARVRTSNPVKLRPQTKLDCPARLCVAIYPDGKWRLTRVVLDHNHEKSPGKSRFYKSNRVLDEHVKRKLQLNDKAGIRTHKSYASLAIEAGGPDKLPYLEKDCRNYLDKVRRLRLVEGDAAAMHSYFMKMKADNSDFFFAMDLNEKGRLRNVFWADARSRAACKEFGDVVTFDTTYLVNKYDMPFAPFVGVNHHGQSILLGCGLVSHEDTESFSWLFKTWMTCMWGCAPQAIITDQDMAMKNAIELVFPNTRHRWCLWHILKKVPEKLGGYDAYDSIAFCLHNAVYDSLTIEEFENAWAAFIGKYQLENNEWLHGLYLERERWVPAFVKDVFWAGMSTTQRSESMNSYFDGYINSKTTLKQFVEQYENALAKKVEIERHADFTSWNSYIPCITEDELEKQFQSAYTIAKFKEFRDEFVGKLQCSLYERKVGDICYEYEIKEWVSFGEDKRKKRVSFTVSYNGGESNEANCNCRLFEFRGMLCRHQLMVFHERGIEKVPDKYVLRRWSKNVKRAHTKIRINYDNSSMTVERHRHDNMCNLFDEVVDLAEDCEEKYVNVMRWVRELKKELVDSSLASGTNMVSSTPIDSGSFEDKVLPSKESTDVLDPLVVSRKGRPRSKRKQSMVEKSGKRKRERKKKALSKEKGKEAEEIGHTITGGQVSLTQENASVNLRKTKKSSKEKAKEVKEIGHAITVDHVFGTQESANVNNYSSHTVGQSYSRYMGPLMWQNMMPHNMQPNMAQDQSIIPFPPILCPTETGFNQVMNNLPSLQSNLSGSQFWRGGQSTSSTENQSWRGAQPFPFFF